MECAKDNYTIDFIIVFLYLDTITTGKKVPVYTGYLKKSNILDLKNNEQILILFNFPHAFIDQAFLRDKISQILISQLEKSFGLEHKEDYSFGDFKNDFGEKDFFIGHDRHENEFFEFRYPRY